MLSALARTRLTAKTLRRLPQNRLITASTSVLSSPQASLELSEGERQIFDKLTAKFSPTDLLVQDLSGGCGSFYAVTIAAPHFKGLSTIKQHRLVTETLKEEIGGIHGLQIKTMAS